MQEQKIKMNSEDPAFHMLFQPSKALYDQSKLITSLLIFNQNNNSPKNNQTEAKTVVLRQRSKYEKETELKALKRTLKFGLEYLKETYNTVVHPSSESRSSSSSNSSCEGR